MVTWVQRWRAAVDDAAPDAQRRAIRGRSYARAGRVTQLRVLPGVLVGRVQGSRATPYGVEVEVPPLDEAAWEAVADAAAGQLRHSAALLAGQAPEGLEVELSAEGIVLIPERSELATTCPCSDRSTICAHVVALWEAAAAQLAEDPFLVFALRGRGRARLLADLAERRGRGPRNEEPPTMPIAELDAAHWLTAASSDPDDVVLPEGVPPRRPAPRLALRGDPAGWAGAAGAWDLLAPLVEVAGRRAAALDAGAPWDDPGDPADPPAPAAAGPFTPDASS